MPPPRSNSPALPSAAALPRPGVRDWVLLVALGLIWGASFMAVTIATAGFGPLSIAAGRITLGAIVLTGVIPLTGAQLPPARALKYAAGLGFFSMALPFFLLSWSQTRLPSGFVGVSMAMSPLLTLVLAHFLIKGERATPLKVLGILIGFGGVVLLIGPGAFDSTGGSSEALARLAAAGAAASYAVGSIITRRAPPVHPIGFAAAATTFAAVMILPLALVIEGLPQTPATAPLVALLFLGLIPTALANLMLVAIIRSAGPSFLSLVNYQVPLWSVLFGWLFLSETLPPRVFAALALILFGVAITQARRR